MNLRLLMALKCAESVNLIQNLLIFLIFHIKYIYGVRINKIDYSSSLDLIEIGVSNTNPLIKMENNYIIKTIWNNKTRMAFV